MARGGSRAPRQNLVKRACDACKIRKIKCSETSPCDRCLTANISCTFKKTQLTRGPRNLRDKTIKRISETQGDDAHNKNDNDNGPTPPFPSSSGSASSFSPTGDPARSTSPDSHATQDNFLDLIHFLDTYSKRLYPIWPIVDIARVTADLTTQPTDSQARLLAESIRLATSAQLRLDTACPADTANNVVRAHVAQEYDGSSPDNLDVLRTYFFLHVYHENQWPGGAKSLLYLRQALTLAQMMRLDREQSYAGLASAEQNMRRRILWLLFVTERGVALLHKLPVILKPTSFFPFPGDGAMSSRGDVVPAFLKLVNMFWVFDQSGVFEILQDPGFEGHMISTARDCLELLQARLLVDESSNPAAGDEDDVDGYSVSDVQRADLFVTRQWMRAVIWRAATRMGLPSTSMNPIRIAREFLSFVSQLPQAAIEAHGPTIEFKTFDIASAVVDALNSNFPTSPADQPDEVLHGLQKILCSSRGGNTALTSSLYFQIATMPTATAIQHTLSPGARVEEIDGRHKQQQARNPPSSSLPTDANLSNPDHNTTASLPPSAWADLEDILGVGNTSPFPFGRGGSAGASSGNSPNYHSLDQQTQQMSWPPLDFSTPLISIRRTPSPWTRMILETQQQQHDHSHQPPMDQLEVEEDQDESSVAAAVTLQGLWDETPA